MAEHLLQGGGIFEITDHTTASDWERFIANLEEVLTDWEINKNLPYRELPDGAISSGIWLEKTDILRYGNVVFDIKYQCLEDKHTQEINKPTVDEDSDEDRFSSASSTSYTDNNRDLETPDNEKKEVDYGEYELPENLPVCLHDMLESRNDFASKAHCLVRWYNLRRFLVIAPKGDTIVSEDQVKMILSSASIALSNLDCHVPIFVQIHNPKSNFYQGISEHMNLRTMYEMVYFRRNLKQYSYLSELIGIFREKSGCSLSDPISATIRLNYCLDSFELFTKPIDEFTGNEHSDDEQKPQVKPEAKTKPTSKGPLIQDMRSGVSFERVVEALDDCVPHPYRILRFLHVAALWPPISDKVITDSQVHSDLDPAEAPIWTIRSVVNDNCNMKLVHETQAIYKLLCEAIEYAYDTLDAGTVFTDCDRDSLEATCLRLSYDLSIKPEVILSKNHSDSLRKLIALLFHQAAELREENDALDQLAAQLKKKPSLNALYRNFTRRHRPSVKEFIIRSQVSRPFNPISTPAVPQMMFCTVCDEEFRLCGAFTELCN